MEFIQKEGRVLERRILKAAVGGGAPDHVAAALLSYQNPDGGFGWGLEPDKRVPDSQPLDVEIAWQSLDWAGTAPAALIEPACNYLASIGSGVSCVSAAVCDHPHAAHWSGASYEPSLNPTASLAGYLWKWSIDHPWRATATEWCWSALDERPPTDAHTAMGVLRFLEHVPDRARATAVVESLCPALPTLEWLHYDADAEGYGVSPLQLVPRRDGPWVDLFPADVLEAHLDYLERTQSDDGGWDITWPTIGNAAVSEWRGRLTVQNLLVLRAYGRLDDR